MIGKLPVACVSLLAVLAFLLLFGSGSHVNAATYKMGYASQLSCDGPDKLPGTVDDSCTPDGTYGAYGEGLNADLVSNFDVLNATPKYSMYSLLATMGTPSTWQISTDEEIPDGAYVGDMVAVSTLALFGGSCTGTNIVTIPLHDCSTDITDTIDWDGSISGENLTYGFEDGLPAGCLQYPQHVLDIVGDIKPRARYYGFSTVIEGMPPTQLNFMMFNPGQLTGQPAGGASTAVPPRDDFTDDLGYINFTVLDNPLIPSEGTSALDELCTPLGTTTNLLGVTGGQSFLNADVTAGNVPAAAGIFWVHPEVDEYAVCTVGDCCGDSTDDDSDGEVDEMCGDVRVTNPAAGSGIYGTGSHMAGGYSECYRDADGDTIANNEDECPYNADTGTDTDGDHIDDACDPTSSPGALADEDSDGWRNQADNCPLVFQTSQANDADDDSIGLECDTDSGTQTPPNGDLVADGEFLNDLAWGSICIDALDSDSDGWCDATEDIVGPGTEVLSDKNVQASTPEYTGIDWAVNTTGDDPPGVAPQSCDNYAYYDVNSVLAHGGVLPETPDDGDANTNASEPNCAVIPSDDDQDGVPNSTDNCQSIRNPSQLNTDGATGNALGDACDTDDDGDAIPDVDEWAAGSDPKDVCSPRGWDNNNDNKIDVLDLLNYKGPLQIYYCAPS